MTPAGHTSVYGYMKNPSMVDFPGRLSAVLFTAGCNFSCGFCHNAALMGNPRPGLRWDQLEDACNRFKSDWVNACTISGGEPTIAPDIKDILHFLKDRGFIVKLDTNGSRPDVVADLLPLVDYIAMDIKCAPSSYGDLAGFDHSAAIEESIAIIQYSDVDYEFRTTVIDSFHDREQVDAIGRSVFGAKRFVLQPFLPRDDLPSSRFTTEKRTSPQSLHKAGDILKDYVIDVIIRGAGKDTPAQTTRTTRQSQSAQATRSTD